jgi:hypothetical protein
LSDAVGIAAKENKCESKLSSARSNGSIKLRAGRCREHILILDSAEKPTVHPSRASGRTEEPLKSLEIFPFMLRLSKHSYGSSAESYYRTEGCGINSSFGSVRAQMKQLEV